MYKTQFPPGFLFVKSAKEVKVITLFNVLKFMLNGIII